MGLADHLIPSNVKNQRLQPFYATPQGAEPIEACPEGSKESKESEKQLPSTQKETNSELKGTPQQKGETSMHWKWKKYFQLLNL